MTETRNIEIASNIMVQLGGNKFLTMTDAKNVFAIDNGVRMNLPRNQSNANRLEITLDNSDLYTMRFYHSISCKYRVEKNQFVPEQTKEIAIFYSVYFDQLQRIFTQITGLDTHL